MRHSWLISLAATLCAVALMARPARPAAESVDIDLTQWTPPDIATVADDPFEPLVREWDGPAALTPRQSRRPS